MCVAGDAAGWIALGHQRAGDDDGTARVLLDEIANRGRTQAVAQPVAAEEQRGVRLERRPEEIDELGIRGPVRLRSDVAVDLVSPRMPHRIRLGDLPGVL